MPTICKRIEAKFRRSKEVVFLRRDFARLGGDRQVSRALRQLCAAGAIVRVGQGIYVRARASSVTGKPVPALTLIEIGLQALSKLGVSADLGNAAREYMAGKTTPGGDRHQHRQSADHEKDRLREAASAVRAELLSLVVPVRLGEVIGESLIKHVQTIGHPAHRTKRLCLTARW